MQCRTILTRVSTPTETWRIYRTETRYEVSGQGSGELEGKGYGRRGGFREYPGGGRTEE